MKQDFVWIVAGGPMQVPLIEEFKNRNLEVLVSARNPDAPGCKIADEVIGIDTYDVGMHLEIAEKMSVKPIAVATMGADVGPTVSALAEYFGLYAETTEVASRCRNKIEMRKTLNAPHPVFITTRDIDMIHTTWTGKCIFAGVPAYPCVLKPAELSGSRGVSIIRTAFDWHRAIERAKRAAPKARIFLVEEYITGPEVAVDFFVINGKLILANAVYRLFHHFGLEAGHINPYHPPQELLDLAQAAAEKLGVTTGPFKADFICSPRYGWVLVECATRLSGGWDSELTCPIATGRDLVGAMADYALYNRVSKRKLKIKKDKYACAYAPLLNPGKVSAWKVPENLPGLHKVIINSMDEIDLIDDCTKRPVFVITEGDSPYQAYRRALKATRNIEVIYDF